MCIANCLLCNKEFDDFSVLDDMVEYALEYYCIFNGVIEKAEGAEEEIEFDDYEPLVPRVSWETTFRFTYWLGLLFDGMVKKDPGLMLNEVTERQVELMEKGILGTQEGVEQTKLHSWCMSMLCEPWQRIKLSKKSVTLINEMQARVGSRATCS
jgi:hypothetical protein